MKKNLLISILCLFFLLGYFNSNAQWQQTKGTYGGYVNCMVSDGDNIFAGTNNGIYFSNDNGNSWTAINNGFPSNLIVNSIAINGTTIYAGTSGNGIYLSENSGNSWIQSNNGLPSNISVYDLAINNSNVYAGTRSPREIFSSTDNGRSWNAISINSTLGYVKSIAVSGTRIFIGTEKGLSLSTNNGNSWTSVHNEPVNDIAIKENYVFTVGDYGVNRSEDYEITWRSSENGIKSGVAGIYTIFVHGSSVFAGTFYSIFKSDNFGDSWSSSSIGLPPNSRASFLANSGSTIFAGMDGFGLFKSTDNGNLWTESNNGITNTRVMSLASSGNNIFAGTWSSGLFFL